MAVISSSSRMRARGREGGERAVVFYRHFPAGVTNSLLYLVEFKPQISALLKNQIKRAYCRIRETEKTSNKLDEGASGDQSNRDDNRSTTRTQPAHTPALKPHQNTPLLEHSSQPSSSPARLAPKAIRASTWRACSPLRCPYDSCGQTAWQSENASANGHEASTKATEECRSADLAWSRWASLRARACTSDL